MFIKEKIYGYYIFSPESIFYIQGGKLCENGKSVAAVNENVLQLIDVTPYIYIEIISEEDGFERTLVFDKETKVIFRDDKLYSFVFRDRVNDFMVALKMDKDFNSWFHIFNLKSGDIYNLNKRNLSQFKIVLNNKFLFLQNNSIIELIDFIDHQSIWQVSMNDKNFNTDSTYEVDNIIGSYNNTFWFYAGKSNLIGLNIDSGEVVYCIDLYQLLGLIDIDKKREFVFDKVNPFHLDERNGILKAFANRYYIEVNLNTIEGKIKKDFGENFKTSWRITRGRYYQGDKNLYFIGKRQGENVNRSVGIFDTELCEIIWYDEPLEKKKFLFFSDIPQANDKYLGVLDTENNLRIYERENMIINKHK